MKAIARPAGACATATAACFHEDMKAGVLIPDRLTCRIVRAAARIPAECRSLSSLGAPAWRTIASQ